MTKIFFLLAMVITLSCCKKTDEVTPAQEWNGKDLKVAGFLLKDTIDLKKGECVLDESRNYRICFDSVLTDSRCPVDVYCIWEGEAIARFTFTNKNGHAFVYDLKAYAKDTTVCGYNIAFIDLKPYPDTRILRDPEKYEATIVIRNK